jgi:hypothetical protein
MSTVNLSSYPRETLEHLLRMLKSYRASLKQIGKRAELIDPLDPPSLRAIIEHHSSMEPEDAEKYAKAAIAFAFPKYTGASAVLRKNDTLKGGARVFVGDDMVDVSLQKFESLLK